MHAALETSFFLGCWKQGRKQNRLKTNSHLKYKKWFTRLLGDLPKLFFWFHDLLLIYFNDNYIIPTKIIIAHQKTLPLLKTEWIKLLHIFIMITKLWSTHGTDLGPEKILSSFVRPVVRTWWFNLSLLMTLHVFLLSHEVPATGWKKK